MTERSAHTSFSPLERLSEHVTRWAGSSTAFGLALAAVVVWLLMGPLVHFSDTWQLVINTATTIVTFLIVFLLQRTQNKDALALHVKLNELVAALKGASNRLIDVEDLSEDELRVLERHYHDLSVAADRRSKVTEPHTVEEVRARHRRKKWKQTPPHP